MLATSSVNLPPTDFLDSFAQFLNVDVAAGKASSDTLKNYACQTRKYLDWCKEFKINPLKATQEDIKQYRRWLVEVMEYKPATISLKLIVVRYTGLMPNYILCRIGLDNRSEKVYRFLALRGLKTTRINSSKTSEWLTCTKSFGSEGIFHPSSNKKRVKTEFRSIDDAILNINFAPSFH